VPTVPNSHGYHQLEPAGPPGVRRVPDREKEPGSRDFAVRQGRIGRPAVQGRADTRRTTHADRTDSPLSLPSRFAVYPTERPSSAAAGAEEPIHLGKPSCPRRLLQRLVRRLGLIEEHERQPIRNGLTTEFAVAEPLV